MSQKSSTPRAFSEKLISPLCGRLARSRPDLVAYRIPGESPLLGKAAIPSPTATSGVVTPMAVSSPQPF
jgi:hypothetical protein